MDVRACKAMLMRSAIVFAFAGRYNTHHRFHSRLLSTGPLSVRISCSKISYCTKCKNANKDSAYDTGTSSSRRSRLPWNLRAFMVFSPMLSVAMV